MSGSMIDKTLFRKKKPEAGVPTLRTKACHPLSDLVVTGQKVGKGKGNEIFLLWSVIANSN